MIKVVKRKANHSSQLFCFELKWRHVQFVFSAYLLLFFIVVLQQEYHNYSAFLLCNYLFLVWLSFPCFTLDVELVLVTGFFMFILWSPLTQIYPATGSSALSNRIFFFFWDAQRWLAVFTFLYIVFVTSHCLWIFDPFVLLWQEFEVK